MSSYPSRPRTRSEITRSNDYAQQELAQFVAIALPLSNRIVAVQTALGNGPYDTFQQRIRNAVIEFMDTNARYIALLSQPNYVPRGDEISQAKRLLTTAVNQAEFRQQTYQNLNNVRRTLDIEYDSYPSQPQIASEIARSRDYAQQQFVQFVNLALPLSLRVNAVEAALGNVQNGNQRFVRRAIFDFRNAIGRYSNRITRAGYVPYGDEISHARTKLEKTVNEAELRLRAYQNPNNVRRELTYDEDDNDDDGGDDDSDEDDD